MTATLLEQFLAEDCTPYVRDLLRAGLDPESTKGRHFDFNRFEVTIQLDEGTVLLQDVLDVTEAGTQLIPLAEFASALGRCTGK